MVWEGLDGLWAWGSVTKASKFLQNIHPKSVVTYQRALLETSVTEAKVWMLGGICCLGWSPCVTAEPSVWVTGWSHNLCLPSGVRTWLEDKQAPLLSPGIPNPNPFHRNSNPPCLSQPGRHRCLFSTSCQKNNLPCRIKPSWLFAGFIGSAEPDVPHALMSYLRRCLSRRRTPSPWKCRSPLPSSPAGRRSASRSCPGCICRCRYTSQGIPLQGKQPHGQTHWKDKATQPWKRIIKWLLFFCCFALPSVYFSTLTWCLPTWRELSHFGIRTVVTTPWGTVSQEVLTGQPQLLNNKITE